MEQLIKVSVGWRTQYVPAGQITHVEAEGNYTCLHTADGRSYLLTKNLRQVGSLLPDFWRLHRSYLVNPAFIAGWLVVVRQQGRVRLLSGLSLPVARRRLSSIAKLAKQTQAP